WLIGRVSGCVMRGVDRHNVGGNLGAAALERSTDVYGSSLRFRHFAHSPSVDLPHAQESAENPQLVERTGTGARPTHPTQAGSEMTEIVRIAQLIRLEGNDVEAGGTKGVERFEGSQTITAFAVRAAELACGGLVVEQQKVERPREIAMIAIVNL